MEPRNRPSADPRAVVLRDFELFSLGRHHIEELLECFAENLVFKDCTSDQIYVGREELRAYAMEMYDAVPDLKVENVHLTTEGQTVVAQMEFAGTHAGTFLGVAATGRSIRWPVCTVYEVDDNNQIAEETYYFDTGYVRRQMTGADADRSE